MSKQSSTFLLVDIGNSSIKWCSSVQADIDATALKKEKLTVFRKVYTKDISQDFFLDLWAQLDVPLKVVVSNVADIAVLQALQQACTQLWSLRVIQVTSVDESFSFLNTYKDPAQLGDDRFCVMVGAYQQTDTDYIVVDCGSAITIDIVASCEGKQRAHQGGYILPGLNLMKTSLARQTADVRVDNSHKTNSLLPGDTTETCVNAATTLSAVALIESVFKQQQNEALQCILTGGDAEEVARFLSIKHHIIPDLVMQGLAYISQR